MPSNPERPHARTIAVVYLLFFLTAILGALLRKGLVVASDPVATANNILSHESLYRSGFAMELLSNLFYLALVACFYRLFVPVNRTVSLFAAFFGIAGCTVQIFSGLFQLAPLVVLKDNQWLSAFTLEQQQATTLLCLKLHAQSSYISLVVFAFFDLFLGYLIFKSTFLPRILGVWLMVAGIGWVIFLWPPLATTLSSVIILVGGLAEVVLMLWLLVKGVNISKWQEKASTQIAE